MPIYQSQKNPPDADSLMTLTLALTIFMFTHDDITKHQFLCPLLLTVIPKPRKIARIKLHAYVNE
jgi:hypothetical protein